MKIDDLGTLASAGQPCCLKGNSTALVLMMEYTAPAWCPKLMFQLSNTGF